MEPVEINAGSWYLRALRADERIDDRPAVMASCLDEEIRRWRRRPPATRAEADAYVRLRTRERRRRSWIPGATYWKHRAGPCES